MGDFAAAALRRNRLFELLFSRRIELVTVSLIGGRQFFLRISWQAFHDSVHYRCSKLSVILQETESDQVPRERGLNC